MRIRTGAVTVLALAMVATACGKKKEPVTPTPQTPAKESALPDTAAENARRRAEAEDAARREREAATAAARASLTEMVFFEYDKSDVRSDMQDVLNKKAALLRANPNVALRIDGHADERGTVEYNLALSLRRANAVREYLTGFGIDAARLDVSGFGEERPLESGSNEDAWAKNRRAEFQITRGGDNLVPVK